MKSKDVRIDIIRGIGIILMVLGHSHCPGTYYIYLFHMALFFILGGYCYKTSHTDSFKGFLRFGFKKVIRLYVPFVVFNTILVLIDQFVFNRGMDVKSLILTIANGFFLNQGSTLSGAFWFLKIMLLLLLTYGLIDYLLKRILGNNPKAMIAHCVISVIFLAAGYVCSLKGLLFWGFDKVMSYYILFHIGRIFKEQAPERLAHFKRVLIIIAVLITLIICKRFGNIDLDINQYVNPLFLLVTSIAGWLLVYELSYYLNIAKWTSKPLSIAGTNTIPVLALHFLCFKGVTFIQILVYNLPKESISAFPVLYNLPMWWALYAVVGLIIPVSLSLLYKRLTQRQK